MKNTNNTFWKNLAEVGKSILAHVSISYDGATGSLHIDIIPTDHQGLVPEQQNLLCTQPLPDLLPNAAEVSPNNEANSGAVSFQPETE